MVEIFLKYRFWLKLSKNLKFGQICPKISILVKVVEYFDFGQSLKQCRFWSKYKKKKNILIKIIKKTLTLVTILKKSWFWSKFTKSRIWSKFSQNLDFCLKVSKILDFLSKLTKMSILDKTAENVDYIQIISILVKIVKNVDFGQYLWKSRFWSKFMKNSILVKNCRKIFILVNNFGKSRF